MFGLGGVEMLVIGIAALIFIGPKELPTVMNRVGKVVGQIRRMGSEFQRDSCQSTDEIMSPPPRNGGISSSSSRRPYRTPTPVGP